MTQFRVFYRCLSCKAAIACKAPLIDRTCQCGGLLSRVRKRDIEHNIKAKVDLHRGGLR